MPVTDDDAAGRMRLAWQRLHGIPGGRWLFSRVLGRMIPYTGSIRPQVLVLEPGFARVRMRDRPRVRNHLRSVHAIALTNLAEVTSGLAMTFALPATIRGIVIGLSVGFEKKARGTLTAECRCTVPEVTTRMEFPVTAVVLDGVGDTVALATVVWLLAPRN
jgi:acyl-coenzyme A thioesterase PaaI-like protein